MTDYTPYHADWKDYPDTTTPVDQAALEYIEAGIVGSLQKSGGTMTGGLTLASSGVTFNDATVQTTAGVGLAMVIALGS